MKKRLTTAQIINKKKKGEKITMLTAYDFPMASLLDRTGLDIILVGDSLANVVLGLDSTKQVYMPEMLHHAKAVDRAVERAMVVGDMPYGSYKSPEIGIENARRFVEEAGCNAVKIEWFDGCLDVAEAIVKNGVPVMGHVGLTPQTADKLGGFIVQGRDAESAKNLIKNASDLEQVGCFSVVLECIPDEIAEKITKAISIPTIGIGAGIHCDGQVLVTHDILGLFEKFRPKFVKEYVNLKDPILEAVSNFKKDVELGHFPGKQHSFSISKEELNKLK